MQDVIDKLARELAQAPEPRFDIASTVASGRKVVRRRRIAAGGVVVAAALVVGGTAWLVAPGDGERPDSSQVAVEPDPTPAATPTPTETVPADVPAGEIEPVVTGTDGEPTVNPAAEIIEQASFTASNGKVAEIFHLRLDAVEYYVYLRPQEASSVPLPVQGLTLREWADRQISGAASGQIADDAWVRFDDGSHLTTVLEGLEIVEQLPDPGLGDSFAGPGEPTALAEVLLDGTTYFLAVRPGAGTAAEAISYRRDDQVTTLQQFRTQVRHLYAENSSGGSEGMR